MKSNTNSVTQKRTSLFALHLIDNCSFVLGLSSFWSKIYFTKLKKISEGLQMPKGNVNVVHDELIWKNHIQVLEKELACQY